MSAFRFSLLIGGAFFEFAGIILLAFPDLVPYGVRFSQWQRRHAHALLDQIRRVLGRPRNLTIQVGSAGAVVSAGRVSVMKSSSATATLHQKVEFLLARDQEAQREVNALQNQIEGIQTESSKRLAQTRQEIETRFAQELKSALEIHRPLRIWGAFALLLGLACVTYANFVN